MQLVDLAKTGVGDFEGDSFESAAGVGDGGEGEGGVFRRDGIDQRGGCRQGQPIDVHDAAAGRGVCFLEDEIKVVGAGGVGELGLNGFPVLPSIGDGNVGRAKQGSGRAANANFDMRGRGAAWSGDPEAGVGVFAE